MAGHETDMTDFYVDLPETPPVDDSSLYLELLEIYNAIQKIVKEINTLSDADSVSAEVLSSDYTITSGKAILLTDATAADITITIPADVIAAEGLDLKVKQIAGLNDTIIECTGGIPIEGAANISLALLEAVTLVNQSDNTAVWIISAQI
jgi:hypothetical protein